MHCSRHPPEGEHSEGTVGLVAGGMGKAGAPEVIMEQVAEWRVSPNVIVVDDRLRVVKDKVSKKRVYKADASTQAHQQGCRQVWQLWNYYQYSISACLFS